MSDSTPVLEGVEFAGAAVNVPDAQIYANIAHSIRLGYRQVAPQGIQKDRIVLVGGGPSLDQTFDELKALYFEGAKVVTVNGAYQWCLEHNIKPSAQIVLDARPSNARFVSPEVPDCRYFLASQCHPETWAQVARYTHVAIWHAIGPDEATETLLKDYYRGRFVGVSHKSLGGTTVMIRAIALLRMLGYLRFDLFGVDSCVLGDAHHAYPQPENDADRLRTWTAHPKGRPDLSRRFQCAPWHLKQLEDFLLMIRETGDTFLLRVHGPGLLAYALESAAELEIEEAHASQG